jgi:uncharacterized membrane protein YdbT with pleckstrin-like domain
MGYPAKLLDPDERVVEDLHPHWRRLILPVGLIPVVVGLAAYAVSQRDEAWVRWTVLAVAGAVLVVFSFIPWLRWVTTQYVVTTRRIAVREGVLNRRGRDVPLSRVNDVSFSHNLIERMIFRSGTLTIESAGERGQVVLDDLPRVEEIQRTIYRLSEEEGQRGRTLTVDGDGDGSPDATLHPRQ